LAATLLLLLLLLSDTRCWCFDWYTHSFPLLLLLLLGFPLFHDVVQPQIIMHKPQLIL
jgi:hypothetical protein